MLQKKRSIFEKMKSANDGPSAAEADKEPMPKRDPEFVAHWRRTLEEGNNLQQLVRLLGKVQLFAQASEAFRVELAKVLLPVEYHIGQAVYRQGDASRWMGILLKGKLGREISWDKTRESKRIGDVAPGAMIGDTGLLGVSDLRAITVVASEPSTVLVLDRSSFQAALTASGEKIPVIEDAGNMQSLLAGKETFYTLECFKNLDRDFVAALCDHLEPRLVYPKSVLMRENNYGNEMYILHAGGVRVEKSGRLITTLVSGSGGVVLGDMAVLGSDKRRTATVICESLCLFYVLHGDVFHEILENYPHSKRILDHAYVSRLVSFEMAKVKDEMSQLDQFYGRAHPMPEAQIAEQVYAGGKVLGFSRKKPDKHDKKVTKAAIESSTREKQEGLPDLDSKRGLMLKYAGQDGQSTAQRRSISKASEAAKPAEEAKS